MYFDEIVIVESLIDKTAWFENSRMSTWPSGFLLLGENLGEIRGGVPARFWPPGISFPGEILAAGIFLPGGNLDGIPAETAAGSCQDPGSYFTRSEMMPSQNVPAAGHLAAYNEISAAMS